MFKEIFFVLSLRDRMLDGLSLVSFFNTLLMINTHYYFSSRVFVVGSQREDLERFQILIALSLWTSEKDMKTLSSI